MQRYFITFVCYGAHLHGQASGAVDQHHNLPGSRYMEGDIQLLRAELGKMDQDVYVLDEKRRACVLAALVEVCGWRGWTLLAAHVRTNHVHVVVEAGDGPEKVMNDFKAYASRGLNEAKVDEVGRKRWARHGSTRWLWTDEDVRECVKYVVEGQGGRMAVFVGDWV